jgi:hypothetical protein
MHHGGCHVLMMESRWRSSVDECRRRKFSAKNPEDMLKFGSVTGMGLPEYYLIFCSGTDAKFFRKQGTV